MQPLSSIEIPYKGQSFFIDIAEGKMVSLNRIFEISGATSGREPREWTKLESTKNLIKSINGGKSPILKTKRGIGGGTWAHWQLALSYAQYLSPELHIIVNQVFKERLEETIDPDLGIARSMDRARKVWRARGKSDAWIEKREQGKSIRDHYERTLITHNVKPGEEVGYCTNKIYNGLFFKSRSEIECDIRKNYQDLPNRINIRDYAKLSELAAISLAEALSSEKIEETNAQGVDDCAKISHDKASSVRMVIEADKSKDKLLQPPNKKEVSTNDKEKTRSWIKELKAALNASTPK